jgi:hypothetical protein
MSEQTIGQHNLKAAAVWHSGWSRRRSQRLSFNRDWTIQSHMKGDTTWQSIYWKPVTSVKASAA